MNFKILVLPTVEKWTLDFYYWIIWNMVLLLIKLWHLDDKIEVVLISKVVGFFHLENLISFSVENQNSIVWLPYACHNNLRLFVRSSSVFSYFVALFCNLFSSISRRWKSDIGNWQCHSTSKVWSEQRISRHISH